MNIPSRTPVVRFRTAAWLLACVWVTGCHGAAPREAGTAGPAQPPPIYSAPPAPPALPVGALDLETVVDLAVRNYPSIRGARARAEGAQAGIDVADTSYLPRLDLLWQSVRATRNNISGQYFSQAVVPPISGPVSPKSWDNAWGSLAGAQASWEPFDFGFRGNQVELARAVARQSGADIELAKLDVALGAAEAFLILVAAEEAEKAAHANVERWDVFARSVKTLVDQQLRPGADQSRSEAELAAARNVELQAQQSVEIGRATLMEAMGFREGEARITPGPLLKSPALADIPQYGFAAHPLLARQTASVQTYEARKALVDSAYAPKVNLQLSFSDRGSGFGAAGQTLDPEDGLWPDRYNWAAGVSFTFPLMDYFGLAARSRQEEALARSERSRMDELVVNLYAQERRARSYFVTARKVSENTPIQLRAAQEAQSRSRARYDSGLATLNEVADAQRLLAQAEIDDALARLGIWRAVASAARAQGDLRLLLETLARSRDGK